MTGLLLLDKPEGMTSFSAVNRVRRIIRDSSVPQPNGEKSALPGLKAGHTGTLDPMATGVLPILLGGATRFAEFLPSHNKAYLAGFQLGLTTDTLDITGRVLEERPVAATREDILAALAPFRGNIMQIPPMVSALKKDGKRLYELARQGIEVAREARPIEIFSLELADDMHIHVECSAGTYIRSLIDDLGQSLGCGATMTSLRRTKANGYAIEQCQTLEQLELQKTIISIDQALSTYPEVRVTPAQAVRFRNGGALDLIRLHVKDPLELQLYRVYHEDIFLGLGRVQGDQLAIARLLVE